MNVQLAVRKEEPRRFAKMKVPKRKSPFCKYFGSTDYRLEDLSCQQPSHFKIVLREKKKDKESRIELEKDDEDSRTPPWKGFYKGSSS